MIYSWFFMFYIFKIGFVYLDFFLDLYLYVMEMLIENVIWENMILGKKIFYF